MKLKSTIKALPIALGLAFCGSANAGVVGTSYLEINDLFTEISTDGDTSNGAEVAPGDVANFITIINATRDSNASALYHGASDASNASDNTGVGTSNSTLVCAGPDCASSMTDNSFNVNNLLANDTLGYAIADNNVTGSAIGNGASGFTLADAAIADGNNVIANSSSNIFNNVTAIIEFDILQDVAIRFTALYDLFVDSAISNDIANDFSRTATASASANFNITVNSITTGGNTVLNEGINQSDLAIDLPGLNNINSFFEDDATFATSWVNVTAGVYQLEITQNSNAQVTLVPEPGALVLFGMGLVGLGLRARSKAKK